MKVNWKKERNLEMLPECFLKSVVSDEAKQVMGALLYLCQSYKKASEKGFLVASNSMLYEQTEMRKTSVLVGLEELEAYGLIKRNAGNKREKGKRGTASTYEIEFEKLFQPLEKRKKLSDDELREKFSFLTKKNTPSETSIHRVGAANTPTPANSPTISNNNSEVISKDISSDKVPGISQDISSDKCKNNFPGMSNDKVPGMSKDVSSDKPKINSTGSFHLNNIRKIVENPSYDFLLKDITDKNFRYVVVNKFLSYIRKNNEILNNKSELKSIKNYLFKIITDKNKTMQSQVFYDNCVKLSKKLFDKLDREFNQRENCDKNTGSEKGQGSASDCNPSRVKPYGDIPSTVLVVEEPVGVATRKGTAS